MITRLYVATATQACQSFAGWETTCGFAGTLGAMSVSALALGDLDRARALAEEAVEVGRRSGDRMTESYARFSAGVVLAWRGELDEAERLIEESVRDARQLGNIRSVASWTRALGGIALARGDYAQARRLFEESLALHRTLDDPWGISHSLSRLALVLLEATHDRRRGAWSRRASRSS